MSDQTEQREVERRAVGARKAQGPLAGERLAAARREQQITVLEIAKELHLDEPKVRALEQNNFDILGAPVFAKGHLRKYASLVGVDINDVLQDYYNLNRSSSMPPVVGKVRKQSQEFSPGPWIVTIVILLIAAATYWWSVTTGVSFPISSAPDAGLGLPAIDAEVVAQNNDAVVATPVQSHEASPITTDPPAMESQAAEIVPSGISDQLPAEQTLADGQIRLTIRYLGDCWTEISDASGRRLFFDLGRDGMSVDVSGEAPLSALFGNSENINLSVNGIDYPIAETDRRGVTARLTIDSP